MSEHKKSAPATKMNDKRRFDSEGNPRKFPEDTFVDGQEVAQEATQDSADSSQDDSPKTGPTSGAQETSKSRAKADEMARLTSELEAARARVDTLARAFQEVERDKEEFKRRLQRERERMLDFEKGKIALLLIEAVDELELCLKNADTSALSVGVRMIRENLLKKLKDNEVVVIQLEGTVFNPNFAEAVDLQQVDNPDDNMKILEVLRQGYVFKEQVIRPARVRVARHVPLAET